MNDTIEYQPLSDSYKDHSLPFRLVKRVGDVAMFAAWADGHVPREWEVFVVQKQKAWIAPQGKAYPPKEKVPGPKQWGKLAWTYVEWDGAESRFDMLVKEQEEAQSPGGSPA